MRNWYFRLQDMMPVDSTTATQLLELAQDIEAFDVLTVQVRKPKAATTGLLIVQHSAVLDDAGFVDLSPTFNLASTTTEVQVFSHCLKYLRWRVSGVTGTGSFLIDVVARVH